LDERSLIAHSHYRDEASKLDHVVLAVIAAVTAYGAQSLSPRPFVWTLSAYNIELLSLVALLVALFSAFKRVETTVEVLRLNFGYLHSLERRGKSMQLVHSAAPGLNVETGDVYTPAQAQAEAEAMDRRAEEFRPQLEKMQNASLFWYKTRNRLFLLGLCLLIASRILLGCEAPAF